jgi:hypothetical protein
MQKAVTLWYAVYPLWLTNHERWMCLQHAKSNGLQDLGLEFSVYNLGLRFIHCSRDHGKG